MVVNEYYPVPPQYALLGYSEHVPRIRRRAIVEGALAAKHVVVYTPYNSNYRGVDRYCDIIIPETQYLTDISDLCISIKGSLGHNSVTFSKLTDEDKFLLGNCTLHSIFKSVNVYLNQVQVSSDNIYGHTSLIKHFTRLSNEEIEAGGCLIGLRNPQNFNPIKFDAEVCATIPDDKELRDKGFFYRGKLEIDVGALDSYLLTNVEIRIRLQIADNVQIIGCESTKDFQLKVDDLKLYASHYELRKNANIALEKALQSSPMIYPFKKHNTKSIILGRNQTSIQIDSPFHGQIPNKLYMFMTHLDADRKYELNTFYYSRFGLSRLRLSVDNVDVYNINCSEENELYYNVLKSINKSDTVMTKKMWAEGSNIIVLDLNTEIFEDSPLNLELSKRGNMRINLEFSQNNDHNIIVYLVGEFSATLQIDSNRQINVIE